MATRRTKGVANLKETAPVYDARPKSETLWEAFKRLPKRDQIAFFERLIEDLQLREDLLDSIVIIEARDEPTRSYREFREELVRDGLL